MLSEEERRAAGLPLQGELTLATPADIAFASAVPRDVRNAAGRYLALRSVEWRIEAAREVGDYVLLWISFPEIADGGTDIIYSVKEKSIVGAFLGGYRG